MKKSTAKIKEKKTELYKPVTAIEFGERVRTIREIILQMNQAELAKEIGTIQGVVSRLENGIGGNTNAVFRIINYLNAKGYYGYMIFKEPFSVNNLTIPKDAGNSAAVKAKIEKTVSGLKASNEEAFASLHSLLVQL